MPNVTITQLPAAAPLTGTELVPVVQNGITVRATTAAVAAAPNQTQTFLTLNQEPTLPNSRYLSSGTGLGLTDGGAQSFCRITLNGASGSLEVAGNGLVAKTASNAVVSRAIGTSGSGIAVTNGDGVAGNPTIALSGLPAALAGAGGTGMLAVVGGSVIAGRQILGTSGQVTVANGNGSGDPTLAIASDPVLPGNGAVTVPVGTLGQRPAGSSGQIRFNSTSGVFEGYAAGSWQTLSPSGASTVSTFSGGSTGLTPSSPTSGAITLGGLLAVANGGTGVSSSTGSGSNVLSNSPTLVTPNLGTPSAINLANGTGLPLGAGVTGILPVTSGGTGTSTSTGTGSSVLSNSPTLVTPSLGTPSAVTLTNATGLPLGTGVVGTLPVISGGTGQTSYADGQILIGNSTGNTLTKTTLTAGANVTITNGPGTITIESTGGGGGGGVSSVDVSGGTTGLTTSGGPITTSGTITLAGTLAVANGGTGAVDATNARTNLSAQKIITSGSAAPSGGVDGDIYLQDTVGTIDIATQTYGTLDLLTRTSGATANQLMYGGASGQVAQSAGMVWDAANNRLTVTDKIGVGDVETYSNGLRKIANPAQPLLIEGATVVAPATGNGGSVLILGKNARASGSGGSVELYGGNGVGSASGGTVQATGGTSGNTGTDGDGGSVVFLGGDSTRLNGYGGNVQLIAGNSFATSGGYGGIANLIGGSVANTTGVPGGVALIVGENNAGAVGSFSFSASAGSQVAVTAGTGTTHAKDLPVTVDGVQYYIRLYS